MIGRLQAGGFFKVACPTACSRENSRKAILTPLTVLVCLDGEGKTDFELLQGCVAGARTGRPFLYLFDLVHLDGWDLARVPLLHRKDLLNALLRERTDRDTSILRHSDHIVGDGPAVFAGACRFGLEGIVSKRADSVYEAGQRSRGWVKVKNPAYQREFVASWGRGNGNQLR